MPTPKITAVGRGYAGRCQIIAGLGGVGGALDRLTVQAPARGLRSATALQAPIAIAVQVPAPATHLDQPPTRGER